MRKYKYKSNEFLTKNSFQMFNVITIQQHNLYMYLR